jgi:hypothetical protein
VALYKTPLAKIDVHHFVIGLAAHDNGNHGRRFCCWFHIDSPPLNNDLSVIPCRQKAVNSAGASPRFLEPKKQHSPPSHGPCTTGPWDRHAPSMITGDLPRDRIITLLLAKKKPPLDDNRAVALSLARSLQRVEGVDLTLGYRIVFPAPRTRSVLPHTFCGDRSPGFIH